MRLWLKIAGGAVAVIAVLILLAAYFFGPVVGAFLGKPVFLFNASEKRINQAMLDFAEATGIYVDSPNFAEAKEAAEADLTNRDLLDAAIHAAGGKHSGVFETKDEVEHVSQSPSVEIKDGAVWATVPGVSRTANGQEYADTVAHGITDHAEACAAVVDLRGNVGGDMGPMLAGVSPLLPDGPAMSFVGRVNENDVMVEGNSIHGGGTPTTTSGGKVDLPVAVLVDSETASSAEATMLAFRGLDYSRSFGEPTAGYASANVVVDYPDGRSLMMTTARDKARTGEVFAEDPIHPDAKLSELDAWLDSYCSE